MEGLVGRVSQRLAGLVKRCFEKSLGKTSLFFPDRVTVVTEIKAVLIS